LMMLGLLTGVAFAQAGDVDHGKHLWADVKLCKNCHGANGEGGLAGPRAGDGKSLEAWITQVRTPRANMPAFNDIKVSDQEIADMWQYMQSLPKPASFTPTKFPVPAGAHPGLMLMEQKRCVACHGDGTQLVQFRFTASNRVVDSAAVIKQLRTPAKNMPMFSVAQVTDEQAGQIATYLQSLNKTAAPTTLPVSGGDQSLPVWSIIMLMAGLIMLLGGVFTAERRNA
jgi:mono/diheme cytochrome c family protein